MRTTRLRNNSGDTNPDTPRRDVLIYALTGTDAELL